MRRKTEVVTHKGRDFAISTHVADEIAWMGAYVNGYRPAKYPVPAHQYLTLISPHSVEMCIGVTKQYEGEYIAYDCECVLFVTDFD